jgi:hypothetical protein
MSKPHQQQGLPPTIIPVPASTPAGNPTDPIDAMVQKVYDEPGKYTIDVKPQGESYQMPPEEAKKIISQYATASGASLELGTAAIVYIIQHGGTNQSKKNLSVEMGGTTFTLEKLRDVIKVVSPKGTVRQLAKAIRNLVAAISLTNGWEGPLYKDIRRNNPNDEISPDDAVWCNEIHTDNYDPACPNKIREALIRREEKLRLTHSRIVKKTVPRKQNSSRNARGRNRRRS